MRRASRCLVPLLSALPAAAEPIARLLEGPDVEDARCVIPTAGGGAFVARSRRGRCSASRERARRCA